MSRAHSSISRAWGLAGKGGVQAALNASKHNSWGKSGGAPGLEWGGEVSKSWWTPNPAGYQAKPVLTSPQGCSLSVVAGAVGAPLPETDCLLLFLHLAGVTSVFHCVICCPIATCKPFFLLGFLARRCPQLHGLSTALRSLYLTWDPSPLVLEILPQGTLCSEK